MYDTINNSGYDYMFYVNFGNSNNNMAFFGAKIVYE